VKWQIAIVENHDIDMIFDLDQLIRANRAGSGRLQLENGQPFTHLQAARIDQGRRAPKRHAVGGARATTHLVTSLASPVETFRCMAPTMSL